MATPRKFKMYVETPTKERIYINSYNKMESMKRKVNEIRSQLHYGYTIYVVGQKNTMPFGCYAPMNDTNVVKTLDFFGKVNKRKDNLLRGNRPRVEILPPESRLPVPTEKSMRSKLAEQLAEFAKRTNELMHPEPKRLMGPQLFLPKPQSDSHIPFEREALLKKQREMFPFARGVLEHYDTGVREFPRMEPHPTVM